MNANDLDNDLRKKVKGIAMIGLGYVGLPLAVEFGKKYPTLGFDINPERVKELAGGVDQTLEVENEELKKVIVSEWNTEKGLHVTTHSDQLAHCNVFIVTVPTPTDKNNRPVIVPLQKASETVGKALKKGDYVVYESTVYPGLTEEECIPILEEVSGLTFNEDFFVGYSPERINPGDKKHTVTKIRKVTSGSTPEAALFIDQLYQSVIEAGTYMASSIKVAEAAKVIENSQRDINIAFVNELSKIFNLLGIDTLEVLEAAGTKWNFLPFRPGLVGGHCIGVDPYYLAQKAQEAGYHPEIILAGRRMNDTMGQYVAGAIVKLMIQKDIKVKGSRILMLGITFKENCPDIRNTKAIDVYRELQSYGAKVDLFDPWADPEEVRHEYGVETTTDISKLEGQYDAVVLAVSHKEFLQMDFQKFMNTNSVMYDVKSILPKGKVDGRL
ncbi:MAG: nucleotide sugar dehydrogenase [Bacteroidota bacterium]